MFLYIFSYDTSEVKMLKTLSNLISEYLAKNNSSLTKNDLLKIQYSLQVILGDLTKFLILFLIFLSLNELSIFLFSFILLISIRLFLGGIHCKTFSSCLIFSVIYFLSILFFSNLSIKLPTNFYLLFFIFSIITILIFAPCNNGKRPIKNKVMLKILSLISLTFWSILFFRLSNTKICNCIFISILLQILQVIILNIKGGISNAKICKTFFNSIN